MALDPAVLGLAAARYGLAPQALHPLHGGNFSHVYGFTRDGVASVLRITPPNADVDAADMRAILAWVQVLDAHGAPVAGPVLSVAGRLVETLDHATGCYLVTAVKQARGQLAETLPYDRWSDALFQAWGRAAGKMHAIAQAHAPTDPALRLPEWDQTGNCFNEPFPDALAGTPIARHLAQVRAHLATLPGDPSAYGVIHADFHAANFFVDPETATLTVFDFDDCAQGWYAMDIAMALFDVLVVYPRADRTAFAAHFLTHYLAGYIREKPLDAFWAAELPHFLKLLEINIYGQVYHDHDPADTTSWVGKFLGPYDGGTHDRQRRIERGEPYVDLDFARTLETARP